MGSPVVVSGPFYITELNGAPPNSPYNSWQSMYETDLYNFTGSNTTLQALILGGELCAWGDAAQGGSHSFYSMLDTFRYKDQNFSALQLMRQTSYLSCRRTCRLLLNLGGLRRRLLAVLIQTKIACMFIDAACLHVVFVVIQSIITRVTVFRSIAFRFQYGKVLSVSKHTSV